MTWNGSTRAPDGRRRAAVIRHLAFEDLGLFEAPLIDAGWRISDFEAGVEDVVAAFRETDLVIVLGGPIGVNETGRYPFLKTELRELERRLAAEKPTLGVCLGAQLMAAAMGASVYAGDRKEIGWSEIELTGEGRHSCLMHLENRSVLHWHGDTFDLPANAARLASSELYENQAFSVGRHALGLQFHAEVDSTRIEQWLIGHTCELTSAKINVPLLRKHSKIKGADLRAAAPCIVRDWLAGLA